MKLKNSIALTILTLLLTVSLKSEKDDLISVPANTKHWFDMGPNPTFTAIRLFNNPEGWVAKFSGDDIGSRFPVLDN